MQKVILKIAGMTCAACSGGLEKYLNKQEGIIDALVNLVMEDATITYDDNILSLQDIERFIKEAGFKSLGEFKEIDLVKESKNAKIIFITFTILAIITLYISMGHMFHLPIFNFLNPHYNPIIYVLCLFILATIFIIYGFDIIKNGYKNLIHKTPNMDTLVSLGVLTSYLYSFYNMILIFNHQYNALNNLYFESSAIIIYFIKLGRFIDKKNKDKTKSAISKLVKITPSTANLKVKDKVKKVPLDEVKVGDTLVAAAGEKIAVDGTIISGSSHVDESFITGESMPILKCVGDKVIAGSINYDGNILYEAEKIGKNSTISEVVRLVMAASNAKPNLAKLADKVASVFVPVVMLIAILTFIIYLILGYDFSIAIIRFVTVLVVACPCSLGLATPLAIVISEGVCAKEGILVKNGDILEVASKIDTVIFDKTGTLTYGKLKIANIINYSKLSDQEILELVGSLEYNETHPLAKPFKDYLNENNISPLNVVSGKTIAGLGIEGIINSHKIIVGNSKILAKNQIKNNYLLDEEKLTKDGCSIIYVSKDKEILALIGVKDIIRESAKFLVESLMSAGITPIMATGDNKNVAKIIAKEIGIKEVKAGILPQDKIALVNDLKKNKKVIMMVGDGINDSPALTSADIGLSVANASDIAISSSEVVLINNDLTKILKLIKISQKTVRNIKQNLFWAFFYNILMIPLAIGLVKSISISPMLASLAMVLSSLTVMLNALRLRK